MQAVVNVPITDLRKAPSVHSRQYIQDKDQESQLLFFEPVKIHLQKGNWSFVEALKQKKYSEDQWSGYKGWVQTDHLQIVNALPSTNLICQAPRISLGEMILSLGTQIEGTKINGNQWLIKLSQGRTALVSNSDVREIKQTNSLLENERNWLIEIGAKLVGLPYLWGGLSVFDSDNKAQITGLDCSALTYILYSICGVQIPRDAHDQFLCCQEIEYKDLKKGDFVFLSSLDNPLRMNHVMLFVENDLLLEATIDPGLVRFVEGAKKLGKPLHLIKSKELIQSYHVFFGRYNENIQISLIS